jgi:type IV pilus assembly protein PilP
MLSVLLFTFAGFAGQAPPPARPQAAAQTPTPAAPAAPAAPAPAATAAPAERPDSAGYSYNREGRRDPFVSLAGRGTDPGTTTRAAGVRGLLVSEATVKGIMRGGSGYLAMIQAPDKKTYIVRSGERLLDGVVKGITQDTVMFSQEISDPLALVKQRDVPKRMRASEGGS